MMALQYILDVTQVQMSLRILILIEVCPSVPIFHFSDLSFLLLLLLPLSLIFTELNLCWAHGNYMLIHYSLCVYVFPMQEVDEWISDTEIKERENRNKCKIGWIFEINGATEEWKNEFRGEREKQRSRVATGVVRLLQLFFSNQIPPLILGFSFNSLDWRCEINLTPLLLSSCTAISPGLFCQLSAEFNSNSLCMHICVSVCVFPRETPCIQVTLLYCLLSLLFFHVIPACPLWVSACATGNTFARAAYKTASVCILHCMFPPSQLPDQMM